MWSLMHMNIALSVEVVVGAHGYSLICVYVVFGAHRYSLFCICDLWCT